MPRGKYSAPWLGKKCPTCGSKTVQVLESRVAKHWRRRKKVCVNCGSKGLTLELPATAAYRAAIRDILSMGGWQTRIK